MLRTSLGSLSSCLRSPFWSSSLTSRTFVTDIAVASALIKARGEAAMTQEQVAQAMGTTQAVVARLESGKTMPSTRTLERFAKATRTRLRIRFEPEKPRRSASR